MAASDFSKVAQMFAGGAETETPLICLLKSSTPCSLEREPEKTWDQDGRWRGGERRRVRRKSNVLDVE